MSAQRAADREHLLLAARELVAEIAAPFLQAREHARRRLSIVHGPACATAVMFSSTVSELKMLRSCGTQPMPARRALVGRSASYHCPPSDDRAAEKRCVTPTIELISVVLPMPLRPSSASAWPSASRSEISASTTASP